MKTYLLVVFLSIGFVFSATAQGNILNRTKNRTKQKTNNRVNNRIDQNIDKGLDKIEGLFKKKKKKKKDTDNDQSNADQDTQANDEQAAGFLSGIMGGEKADLRDSYSFNSNFVMKMEMYKKNGKKDGDMFTRYYNSEDESIMGMEHITATKDGQMDKTQAKIIFDGERESMVTIMEEQNQAIAMKMPDVSAYQEAQELESNPEEIPQDVKISRTGRTKNILGYTCYETIMESDEMKAVSWTTKEVEMSQFKAFAGMFMQDKKEKKQLMAVPMEFVMEMESTDKETGEKTILKVVEINPNQGMNVQMSDYQVMNMGGLMNGNKN